MESGRLAEALETLATLERDIPGNPLIIASPETCSRARGARAKRYATSTSRVKSDRSAPMLERIGRARLAAGDAARAAQASRSSCAPIPHRATRPSTHPSRWKAPVSARAAKSALAGRSPRGHADAELLGFFATCKAATAMGRLGWRAAAACARRRSCRASAPRFLQYALYFDGIDAADQKRWAENWARHAWREHAHVPTPHASRPTPHASRLTPAHCIPLRWTFMSTRRCSSWRGC
jgi:hypothetical protein